MHQIVAHRQGRALSLVIASTALLAVTAVHAQTQLPDRLSDEYLQCLSRPGNGPQYPDSDRERRTSGQVRVKLSFTGGDVSPNIEVLAQHASGEMIDAVKRFAQAYRLPCLPAGQTVEAVQSFDFNAQGLVEGSRARAVPQAGSLSLAQCLRTPAKPPHLMSDMPYNTRLARKPKAGNLIVQASFKAIGEPPELKVIYNSLSSRDSDPMLEHVSAYRVACLPEPQRRFDFQQQFQVGVADGERAVLKNMGLVQLLGSVKDLEGERVRFDLGTMACPFQVHWAVGMPLMANTVREVGSRNLNRLEFLSWLSRLRLDVNQDMLEQLLGQSIVLDVPCGSINLG